LIDTELGSARGILLSIAGGEDLSLLEVNEAAEVIRQTATDETQIIFGATIDERLTGQVWVTVIVTGVGGPGRPGRSLVSALTSWVAESPLTGPGSGGFMLVHRARDRSTRVFDFFVAIPGLGDERELALMDHVDVDFSGGSTQRFHIGAASCAIPGAALGLETAHKSFGRLPWRDLFQPAVELARNGVELNDRQAYLHRILDLILRHTPESRAVYEQ